MKEFVGKAIGKLLFAAAVVMLAGVLILAALSVKTLSGEYLTLKNADISQPITGSVSYNDRLYAQLGFGVETDPADGDAEAFLSEFLDESLQKIDLRILSSGILYTMTIVTVAALFLYEKFGRDAKRHTRAVLLAVFAVYAVYVASVAVLHRLFGVPFSLPSGAYLLAAAVSLGCVAGGSCVLAFVLRVLRFKKTAAVLAVPAVFLMFLFGTVFEAKLYVAPTVDSFEYVASIDERVTDTASDVEAYYDEGKNVLIVAGTEYPPRQVENPDYAKGGERVGAYLFELVSPYAGNGLFMIQETEEMTVPLFFTALYALKALALIEFFAPYKTKKSRRSPASSAEAAADEH